MERNEEKHAGLDSVLGTCNAGVAHSMAALIEVQGSLARFPARRPDRSLVIDIEITSAVVHRDIVVAVTGYTTELRVLVEGISAGRVGDQREEVLVAEVVDPRPRCLRVGDHIFPTLIIKVSESLFHITEYLFPCYGTVRAGNG